MVSLQQEMVADTDRSDVAGCRGVAHPLEHGCCAFHLYAFLVQHQLLFDGHLFLPLPVGGRGSPIGELYEHRAFDRYLKLRWSPPTVGGVGQDIQGAGARSGHVCLYAW